MLLWQFITRGHTVQSWRWYSYFGFVPISTACPSHPPVAPSWNLTSHSTHPTHREPARGLLTRVRCRARTWKKIPSPILRGPHSTLSTQADWPKVPLRLQKRLWPPFLLLYNLNFQEVLLITSFNTSMLISLLSCLLFSFPKEKTPCLRRSQPLDYI